jgi:NADH-quinone oxidoreductase subunit L
MMLIGTLALTGFPLTSGYFSKDAIIEAAFVSHSGVGNYAFVLAVFSALLTSFYSWRLIFLAFHGKPRSDPKVLSEAHESPLVMLVPLGLLALGSLGAGFLFKNLFIGDDYHEFWRTVLFIGPDNRILQDIHHVPFAVFAAPTAMMGIGFVIAWIFYLGWPRTPNVLAEKTRPIYLFLLNKWYFDELYDWAFTRPAIRLGRFLWKVGDGSIIDGIGPDGIAARVLEVTRSVVRIQTGYVYHYAFAMLIGVALLITYFMFASGAP